MIRYGALLLAAAVSVSNADAQDKKEKHAFVVVDITSIDDPATFKTLLPIAEKTVDQMHGRFLIRTNAITAYDGSPPNRYVIIEFKDLDDAKKFEASAGWKEVTDIRLKSTHSRQFLVENDVDMSSAPRGQ